MFGFKKIESDEMFDENTTAAESVAADDNVKSETESVKAGEGIKEEVSEELNQLSHDGYRLYKAGDYVTSREKFRKLLELDPTNQYGLVGLGDIARKENKIDVAIKYYSECLDHHKENKYAIIGLADAYRDIRLYDKAISLWEHFLALYAPDII